MCTKRSQRGRALLIAMLTMVMIAMAAGAGLWLYARLPGGAHIDEKTTLSILHSESMAFLVTRRMATQVVVEHAEGDWLGDWHGVLWATVRIHYGVDLQKIQAGGILASWPCSLRLRRRPLRGTGKTTGTKPGHGSAQSEARFHK